MQTFAIAESCDRTNENNIKIPIRFWSSYVNKFWLVIFESKLWPFPNDQREKEIWKKRLRFNYVCLVNVGFMCVLFVLWSEIIYLKVQIPKIWSLSINFNWPKCIWKKEASFYKQKLIRSNYYFVSPPLFVCQEKF